ncbi:hypothetical protein GGI35DRAFT_488720 [Trichoderma velutinum]
MPQPHIHEFDGKLLQEVHSEFVRLYNEYSWQISAVWHIFDRNERARLFLDHCKGRPKSVMFPEMNLNDISTNPKFLMNHFKYRATTSLFQQYSVGLDGALGDGPFIIEKLEQKQLIPDESPPNYYTVFAEDWYGDNVKLIKESKETLEMMEPLIEAGFCVPYATGALIYTRQYIMLLDFRFLILGMLHKSPRSWWTKQQWKTIKQEGTAAAAKLLLTTEKEPEKISAADLLIGAQKQKDYLEEYLTILRGEPSVLVYNANSWLLSRPELVTDDKGRRLPLEADKHISCAIFEVIRGWIQKFAIWSYIYNILEILNNADTNPDYKRVILQELSNICHFEYSRAQAHFVRHVQTGIGARCFKRVANAYDEAGNPRVVMKVKPEELTGGNSHLQYMLRLCQSQTHASQAVQWIDKLDDLYKSHPSDWKPLQEREMDALAELILVVAFIQELSIVLSIPSLSRKTGQTFLVGSRELNSGLNDIQKEIDLQEFSVPVNKLLEPGMASKALAQLDVLVVRNTGAKMDFYYHYVVQECSAYHRTQSRKTKDASEIEQNKFPFTTAYSIAENVDLKNYEENTSLHQALTSANEQAVNAPDESQLQQVYESQMSKKVFSTLFGEPKAGASISWAAFESTMVAMGFSIINGYCSFYTFFPAENMAVKTAFTVSKPSNSKIEGHLIPILARRLKKAYGRFVHFG